MSLRVCTFSDSITELWKRLMRIEEHLAKLKGQPVRYASLLGFFAQREVEKAVEVESSVALIGTSDERWAYLALSAEPDLPRLLRLLSDVESIAAFATLEGWMVPQVRGLGTVTSELTCIRHILYPDHPLPKVSGTPLLRTLRPDDAPTICANSEYGEYISQEYIQEAIRSGHSAGIEEQGALVAWATTHDDLAIGNLHVIPTHRRKGYAASLVSHLASKLRRAGHLPVMNIEEGNTASRALAGRLGFQEDRLVTWIKLG